MVSTGAVLLYDGDCGFCARSASFLRRHISTPARVVAWQVADLPPLGLTAQECASVLHYVAGGRISTGPVAIADVLRSAAGRRGYGWRVLGRLLSLPPVLLLAWPVYRMVARNRHRLPGGTATCELAPPIRS